MLAIPCTSAEDERNFSSAGFTLSERRTRLHVDNFRAEHRIRRYLVGGCSLHEQAGRELMKKKALALLGRLTAELEREKEKKETEEQDEVGFEDS